jgi:hypothetical protein
MTITNGETISLERRSRLGLILCRRAANETSRKLANHLVRSWFAELGIENCNCEQLEKEGQHDKH